MRGSRIDQGGTNLWKVTGGQSHGQWAISKVSTIWTEEFSARSQRLDSFGISGLPLDMLRCHLAHHHEITWSLALKSRHYSH